MYRVIISIGRGSLESGFEAVSFTLIDFDGNQRLRRVGKLPPNPLLKRLYERWKQLYRGYYFNHQRLPYRLELVSDEEDPYYYSDEDFRTCCDRLQQTLDQWLGSADFGPIVNLFRSHLHHDQSFQWIIESEDSTIQHLPWHLWNFFQDYPLAEVAISLPEFEKIFPTEHDLRQDLNVLVILGKTVNHLGDEINVQTDRQIIESLPNVSAVFITKTSLGELRDLLWTRSWDIILFAGHSSGSSPQGKAGFLIESDESHKLITIQDLEAALKGAIHSGLKLVIFNSCDSFELGLDLMRLNLPQCIAMGEAIPDAVAQRFLLYLIQQWAKDQSFVVAVRHARARLKESEEPLFPCASWLPMVCQNPAVLPPTWSESQSEGHPADLLTADTVLDPVNPPRTSSPRLIHSFVKGIVVSAVLIGIRLVGGLEGLELRAFDQFVQLSAETEVDQNIFLITISEADIQYQEKQNMPMRGSLSDQALMQVLEKLKPLSPKVVGIDIFHPFPYEAQLQQTISQSPHFVSACQIGLTDEENTNIPAPPASVINRLAFTDIVFDRDERIRRQLLRLAESSDCPTDYGLGLKLAEVYLGQPVQEKQGTLWLDTLKLNRLTPRSGGYRLPEQEASGYQIMTRFRRASFESMSLQEVLSQPSLNAAFKDKAQGRLILIGLKDPLRDMHQTPLASGPRGRLTGMEIHAHMASQLIEGVQAQRPLLWWWGEWVEMLWISLWMMIGVMVSHFIHKPLFFFVALGGLSAIATMICYGVFGLMGGWIPWAPILLGYGLIMLSYGRDWRLKTLSVLSVDRTG